MRETDGDWHWRIVGMHSIETRLEREEGIENERGRHWSPPFLLPSFKESLDLGAICYVFASLEQSPGMHQQRLLGFTGCHIPNYFFLYRNLFWGEMIHRGHICTVNQNRINFTVVKNDMQSERRREDWCQVVLLVHLTILLSSGQKWP